MGHQSNRCGTFVFHAPIVIDHDITIFCDYDIQPERIKVHSRSGHASSLDVECPHISYHTLISRVPLVALNFRHSSGEGPYQIEVLLATLHEKSREVQSFIEPGYSSTWSDSLSEVQKSSRSELWKREIVRHR